MKKVSFVRVESGRRNKPLIGKVFRVIGEHKDHYDVFVNKSSKVKVRKADCSIMTETEGYEYSEDFHTSLLSVSESDWLVIMDLMDVNYGDEEQSGSAGEGQQSAEGSDGDSEHDAEGDEATGSENDSKDGNQEDEASPKATPPDPSGSASPESVLQPLMAILPSFIHSAFVSVSVTLDNDLRWCVDTKIDTVELSEFGLQYPLVLVPSSGDGVVVSVSDTNYLLPNFAVEPLFKYVMLVFGPDKLYAMNKGGSLKSYAVTISRGFESHADIKDACKSVVAFFATVAQEELDSFSFEQEQAAAVLLENFLIFAED